MNATAKTFIHLWFQGYIWTLWPLPACLSFFCLDPGHLDFLTFNLSSHSLWNDAYITYFCHFFSFYSYSYFSYRYFYCTDIGAMLANSAFPHSRNLDGWAPVSSLCHSYSFTHLHRMIPSFSPFWKSGPMGWPVTSSIQPLSSSSFDKSYFCTICKYRMFFFF